MTVCGITSLRLDQHASFNMLLAGLDSGTQGGRNEGKKQTNDKKEPIKKLLATSLLW